MFGVLKNIIYSLLLIVLFTSCDAVVEEEPIINPVRGVWNSYYKDTDSLLMTRVFTADCYSYFSFANGQNQTELNKQSYTISDTHIVLYKYKQAYKLKKDTLWITNSSNDQITKYRKVY